MLFNEVIGHKDLRDKLVHAVEEQRVAHALMFVGSEGRGGLPMAWAFARYLLCPNKTENDACGECPSCLKTGHLSHPDLHLSFPIQLSKKTPTTDHFVNQFRELLLRQPYVNEIGWYQEMEDENKQGVIGVAESENIVKKLSLKPYEGGYKVMIIWLPERMRPEAANKLLKIIEEPPQKTFFFLVTQDQEQILPTIRSRTQIMTIPPLTDEAITEGLVKEIGIPEQRAYSVARLSDGNYWEALQIAGREDQEKENFKAFAELMRLSFKKDIGKALEWAEGIATIGRERQKNMLSYAMNLLRQALVNNHLGDEHVRLEGEELEFLRKFAPYTDRDNLPELVEELNKAWHEIGRNINPRILFLDLALTFFTLIANPKRAKEKKRS